MYLSRALREGKSGGVAPSVWPWSPPIGSIVSPMSPTEPAPFDREFGTKVGAASRHPSFPLWPRHCDHCTSIIPIMAHIAPSALRQASRLASKSILSSTRRRAVPALTRVVTAPTQAASSTRTYVTESKRDNAQVQVETAIRLDRKQLEKAGLTISAQDGSNTHVSPMAGTLLCSPWLVEVQASANINQTFSSRRQ